MGVSVTGTPPPQTISSRSGDEHPPLGYPWTWMLVVALMAAGELLSFATVLDWDFWSWVLRDDWTVAAGTGLIYGPPIVLGFVGRLVYRRVPHLAVLGALSWVTAWAILATAIGTGGVGQPRVAFTVGLFFVVVLLMLAGALVARVVIAVTSPLRQPTSGATRPAKGRAGSRYSLAMVGLVAATGVALLGAALGGRDAGGISSLSYTPNPVYNDDPFITVSFTTTARARPGYHYVAWFTSWNWGAYACVRDAASDNPLSGGSRRTRMLGGSDKTHVVRLRPREWDAQMRRADGEWCSGDATITVGIDRIAARDEKDLQRLRDVEFEVRVRGVGTSG